MSDFVFTPNDICSVGLKVLGVPGNVAPDIEDVPYRHLKAYIYYDPPWYESAHSGRQNFLARGQLAPVVPLTSFDMLNMYKGFMRFAHTPGIRWDIYGLIPIIVGGVVKCYYVIAELER